MAGDWIKIESYPGYEVSSAGEVRSLDRRVKGKHGSMFKKGRILAQHKGTGGYKFVTLSINNKQYRCRTHVLVAASFIGPRPRHHDVDHIDRDRTNNTLENLRYLPRRINRGQAREVV